MIVVFWVAGVIVGRKTFVLLIVCFLTIVVVPTTGCRDKGQRGTRQPVGQLKLDTKRLFNYETGPNSRVVGNTLPPWYSGEYNSHRLSMTGGTPPYTWKYKNPAGGVVSPTARVSGITFGAGGLVEGTADELPGSTLYRELYVTAIVTDSSHPALSTQIPLRLHIIDNRAAIARQVTERHFLEVTKMIQSAIAAEGGMPPGTRLSFSNAIIGEPKKVDGPQWSVPTEFKVKVAVSVPGFSTSVGGYAKSKVVVDVKKKSVIDVKLVEYKIGR